jgi:hypothetical protein
LVVGLLAAVFSRSDTKNTNRTLLWVFVSSENTIGRIEILAHNSYM